MLFLYDVEAQPCFHLYNTVVVLGIQTWEQIIRTDAKGNWIFHFRMQEKEDGAEKKSVKAKQERRWKSEETIWEVRIRIFSLLQLQQLSVKSQAIHYKIRSPKMASNCGKLTWAVRQHCCYWSFCKTESNQIQVFVWYL